MAGNDQPTSIPINTSGVDIPSFENRGQTGTLFSVYENTGRDEYMFQIEHELLKLREYKRQTEARTSQPQFQHQQTIFGTVPPSLVSTHEASTSIPFSTSGSFDYRIPIYLPPQQKQVCSFKTFMNSKPSKYRGSSNPSVTLDWLRDTERKFEVCKCEEEDKVPYAVQLLKGQAMVWWDSITAALTPQQKESIRWSDFYNEVCKQYCSVFDMSRIRREFMDLHLTDEMSIDELISQFSEKLRFVLQWVPNDKTRIEHFVGTLPPEYRTTVRLAGSLSQAFSLARAVDGDFRARDKQNKNKELQQLQGDLSENKNKKKGQSKSDVGSNMIDQSTWCFKCKSRHVGSCTVQTARCIKCGLFGHEIKDCNYPSFVCWNCQKEGHRAVECREVIRQGSGLVGTSSSSSHKRKNPPSKAGRAFQMAFEGTVETDDDTTDTEETQ